VTATPPAPGPAGAGRRRPDPDALALGFHAAANVIHATLNHISELDTADLPLVDGKVVRIVALSEVEEWLLGLEARVRNGTIL
jgi:hypothetical protein